MRISGIHHVLVAIPPGSEERAREFFGALLGLVEVAKPPQLAGRGGIWHRCGAVDLHLGVDAEFRPAHKRHVALSVADLAGLRGRLGAHGVPTWEDEALPGHRRFYPAIRLGTGLNLWSARPQPGARRVFRLRPTRGAGKEPR